MAARLIKGKDIRQMGGGNIGTLNTFREVGHKAGIAVLLVDAGKGIAPMAIALWLLQLPLPWVLGAGLAAVVGHIWMVFLKFKGGRGTATAVGVFSAIMPFYEYWLGLVIFIALLAIPLIITRNVTLAVAISFASLPFIGWLVMQSVLFIVCSVAISILIGLKFFPTAKAAWAKAGGMKNFIYGR